MENSKKYRNVCKEYQDMCNSDEDNTEVTEGRIMREERVSPITSTDVGEELTKDAGGYNPPAYLQLAVPPQSIIEGRPVENESEDENSINWKALDKNAMTYELDKFEKNIMLIFNHFDVPGHKHRHGTQKDVDALKKTFKPLGFECTEYTDLSKSEIFEKLETLIDTTDFTDIGCVAVSILTHGENNGELWAKDSKYSEVDVLNYFKGDRNPKLLTKPKLLIIQACRGLKSTPAVKVFRSQSTIRKDHKEPQHYHLPIEADILVLHGSALHTPALRCEKNGSWLIQAFCYNIKKLAADHDLESILLEVKRTIAFNKSYKETNDEGVTELLTQMPVVTSTLLRKLYFHRSGFEVKDAKSQITWLSPTADDVSSSENTSRKDTAADTIICRCAMKHFAYARDLVRHYESHFDDPIIQSVLTLADKVTDDSDIEYVTDVRNLLCAHLKNLNISNSHLLYLDCDK